MSGGLVGSGFSRRIELARLVLPPSEPAPKSTTLALLLSILIGAPDQAADNPADLAARVLSSDLAAREEAEGKIEEMGRSALPALRLALGKAEGEEATRRLAELVDRIERRRLLRGTPVDFGPDPGAGPATVAGALAGLGRRANLAIATRPPGDPTWSRPANLAAATRGASGFWDAIERLGAAGGFRVETLRPEFAGPADFAAVQVVPDPGPRPPSSIAGPYRVDLMSLVRRRSATQVDPGDPPRSLDTMEMEVALASEPGMIVEPAGAPRLVEAVDDRGGDLRPATGPEFRPIPSSIRDWRPARRVPLESAFALGRSAAGGGAIRRIRGEIPVIAYARTGPIAVLPIAGSEGRVASTGGVTLLVRRVERSGDRIEAMTVQVRGVGVTAGESASIAAGPHARSAGPFVPPFRPGDHLEVVDDRGTPVFAHHQGTVPPGSSPVAEIRITFPLGGGTGPPVALRYYGLVAEAIEVPFCFEGVPLP